MPFRFHAPNVQGHVTLKLSKVCSVSDCKIDVVDSAASAVDEMLPKYAAWRLVAAAWTKASVTPLGTDYL